jgi:pimeloyl-ACP methyl ester carboxylesterase
LRGLKFSLSFELLGFHHLDKEQIMKTHSVKVTLIFAALLTIVAGCGKAAEAEYPNPESLKTWVGEGHYRTFEGLQVFVHSSGPKSRDGRGVLIVHGYPGSSWDWKGVAAVVSDQAHVVVPDMLGFGQSDKPLTGTYKDNYSLMRQADLYEAIAKEEGLTNVILVAHDMGQTVGAELMARHDEGSLSFKISHAIIVNGSTIMDLIQMRPFQVEALAKPDQALTEHGDFAAWREDLRPTFSKDHAASEETLDIMAAQIFAKDGDLVMVQMLRYLNERNEYYDRWVGTLTGFHSAPMSVYWGLQDPVALEPMVNRIKAWRPVTDVYKMPDVGHWPSIEVPERIGKAILDRVGGYNGD